ncbi:MAG: hypothetical protein E6G66_05995 [Actinobacteria bacterium]|nr:MAG: hypothetical protein E6G66_05995 [Actinomycetota bacterium]
MIRRGWLVLGLGAIELIVGLARLRLQAPASAPGGDPGGQIHGTLAQVAVALPADADVESRYDAAAMWSDCPGRAGTAGWQDPLVAITFRTGTDARTVMAHADAALTSLGWAPVPDMKDMVWSKLSANSSGPATARMSSNGGARAGGSWTLTASAAVPGPHRSAAC